MKMNIKGLVFVGFAAAVFASAANAANDKIVTSKTYVDTKYVGAEGGHITITPNETTGKNEISADVGVTGVDTHDGTHLNVVNGIVTLPEEQTVGTATITVTDGANYTDTFGVNATTDKTITIPVDTNTTYSAGTHTTITGNDNAINVTVDGVIADGNTGIVDGNTVYDYVTDHFDEYVEGTNVSFTAGTGDNVGKTVISATDTTYTAGTHVANLTNNVINVEGDGTITSGNDHLVTGGTVHSYVGTGTITVTQDGQSDQTFTVNDSGNTTISIAAPWTAPTANYCTASTPCALVNDGTNITWERIQQ